MFENLKDTLLLQGALISAANTNSGNILDCGESEDALIIVVNSVNKIINHSLVDIKDERENIKTQLHLHERLHAAIFFTALRTRGMAFSSLQTFYSSIADVWPAIDFKFYIELNFKCDWSECFIKCASQLPSDLLIQVIKIILDLSLSREIKIYTWHLILQTLTVKLLEVPYDGEIESSFQFRSIEDSPVKENQNIETTEEGQDDSDAESHNKKSQEELMLLKEMYNNLCDHIFDEINKSKDVDFIKILLHEVKTLLKIILIDRERNYKSISRYVDFMNIYNVLNNHLKSNEWQENLKVVMNNSSYLAVKHSYATTSWSISENYLCFLLSHYWNKMYSDFCFKIELSIRNCLVYSEMIMNSFLYETLNTLNPLVVSCNEIGHEHLNFLCKILQLDFEGTSFVVEMLLSNPAVIEENNMVHILEENSYAIDFLKVYPFILHCIKAIKSQDFKFRLLKIFYKLLPADNIKIYNDVLITILTEHGYTEEFQLPNFFEQLEEVFRTTPTIKQAEETLPVLFIQNPLCVLKRVIEQTLVQGPEGISYIEPLRYVQYACTYQRNKKAMPALVGILNEYFEKKELISCESNNMVTLFKFLLKLQSTRAHIMTLNVFVNRCIIPKLHQDMDKIELILECLHVSLTTLIQTDTLYIAHETLISLIIAVGKLVNDCILTQNSKLKASVLPVVQVLANHQPVSGDIKDAEKERIFSSFQSFHEVAYVYMKEFIPSNIEFSSKEYIWASCCYSKDSSHFEEQFSIETLSHPILLQTLVEVLPYLTKDEWIHSIDLIKICCKKNALRDEILNALDKPFHLSEDELEMYAVVSCLISSMHFILHENKENAYLISCFTTSLMTILSQEEVRNTSLLMTILLDYCYLAEYTSPDVCSLITLVLLDLKSIIASCSEKCFNDDCKKLISCAVKCLPNFCDKSKVLTS